MDAVTQKFSLWLSANLNPWTVIGLCGQALFMTRFIVQWIASERARRSVIPNMFWYFSLGGGLIVLAYGLHKGDAVIIMGQLPGTVVYARNLWLIHKNGKVQAGDADV